MCTCVGVTILITLKSTFITLSLLLLHQVDFWYTLYCGICYKQAAVAGQRLREDAAAGLDALGGEGRPEAREANQDNDDNGEANKDNDNNASVPLGSDANWDDLGKTVFDKAVYGRGAGYLVCQARCILLLYYFLR